MPSVFSMIIAGDLPGRFVWRDDTCVAFLSINPLAPGHTLVVPREEVDHWLDLEPGAWAHCSDVAQRVGRAVQRAYDPPRVGMAVVGFEVPHVHLHVSQIHAIDDLDFAKAATDPDPAELDDAAARVRAALRDLGEAHVAD
ncbi:MAG: HIT family protein [Actinomycetes bacterium]